MCFSKHASSHLVNVKLAQLSVATDLPDVVGHIHFRCKFVNCQHVKTSASGMQFMRVSQHMPAWEINASLRSRVPATQEAWLVLRPK